MWIARARLAARIALALTALVLDAMTRSAIPDGVASLLIGLLLVGVAYLLVRRNGALLIDEAAPSDVRERLRKQIASEPWIGDVPKLTAVRLGPRQLLVLAHVVPSDGANLLANVAGLRARLLALPAICAVEITPVEGDRAG